MFRIAQIIAETANRNRLPWVTLVISAIVAGEVHVEGKGKPLFELGILLHWFAEQHYAPNEMGSGKVEMRGALTHRLQLLSMTFTRPKSSTGN